MRATHHEHKLRDAAAAIGPVGIAARVVGGATFLAAALVWRTPSWTDVVLGLVVLPAVAIGLLAAWRARRDASPLDATGSMGHVVNAAVFTPLFFLPATAGLAFLFYGGLDARRRRPPLGRLRGHRHRQRGPRPQRPGGLRAVRARRRHGSRARAGTIRPLGWRVLLRARPDRSQRALGSLREPSSPSVTPSPASWRMRVQVSSRPQALRMHGPAKRKK